MIRLSLILAAFLVSSCLFTQSAAAQADRVYYAEIDVEGGFGEEITAKGLDDALELAKRRKVQYVIFNVESPGGYLYEADAIMDVLREYEEEFEYVTVVEKGGAFSAACVFVALAHHLYIRPGGAFGAATAYSTDSSTGSTEVDAKLNSGWASQLASAAESRGRPGLPFRAMVEQSVVVYGNAETKEFATESKGSGWDEYDGSDTILTLRAEQAQAMGIAEIYEERTAKGLGEMLGVDAEAWRTRGGSMSAAFQRAGRARAKLEKDWESTISVFKQSMNRIPDQIVGEAAAGRALRDVNNALAALTRMATLNREADEQGALHLRIPDDMGHDAYVTINDLRSDILRYLD